MPDPVAADASLRARFAGLARSRPTRHPALNVTIWSAVALVLLLIVVAAVVGDSGRKKVSAPPATIAPSTTTTNSFSVDDSSVAASPAQASAAPTDSTPTDATPVPVDTTGGVVVNAAGAVLPDPARTPGATNPAVTQDDIDSTICVSGWTATIRPPASYTTALKVRQLATGYAYHGDTATGDYEEDHLISLEIGGSPDSERNLWPEPYSGPDGARAKDVVENKLHALVCSRSISLATAQQAIASNWWDAYLHYVGVPAPQTTARAVPPPPPATAPASAPVSALSCAATMSNAGPAQYSTTDVVVHTAAGAAVTATAHYKTTDTTHTGTAQSNGVADIPFSISRATIGYPVEVDVTVSRAGATQTCSTSFTPR